MFGLVGWLFDAYSSLYGHLLVLFTNFSLLNIFLAMKLALTLLIISCFLTFVVGNCGSSTESTCFNDYSNCQSASNTTECQCIAIWANCLQSNNCGLSTIFSATCKAAQCGSICYSSAGNVLSLNFAYIVGVIIAMFALIL